MWYVTWVESPFLHIGRRQSHHRAWCPAPCYALHCERLRGGALWQGGRGRACRISTSGIWRMAQVSPWRAVALAAPPIPTTAGQAELLDIKVDFFPFSVLNIFHACYPAPYQNYYTKVTYVVPKPVFGAPSAAASVCRFSNYLFILFSCPGGILGNKLPVKSSFLLLLAVTDQCDVILIKFCFASLFDCCGLNLMITAQNSTRSRLNPAQSVNVYVDSPNQSKSLLLESKLFAFFHINSSRQ
jgi:hypothetical protein